MWTPIHYWRQTSWKSRENVYVYAEMSLFQLLCSHLFLLNMQSVAYHWKGLDQKTMSVWWSEIITHLKVLITGARDTTWMTEKYAWLLLSACNRLWICYVGAHIYWLWVVPGDLYASFNLSPLAGVIKTHLCFHQVIFTTLWDFHDIFKRCFHDMQDSI